MKEKQNKERKEERRMEGMKQERLMESRKEWSEERRKQEKGRKNEIKRISVSTFPSEYKHLKIACKYITWANVLRSSDVKSAFHLQKPWVMWTIFKNNYFILLIEAVFEKWAVEKNHRGYGIMVHVASPSRPLKNLFQGLRPLAQLVNKVLIHRYCCTLTKTAIVLIVKFVHLSADSK